MQEVKFIPVKSSQIKAIGHVQETLYVKFNKGQIYSYTPVTREQFEEFKNAKSAGKYFHKNLKQNPELKIQHENIEIK